MPKYLLDYIRLCRECSLDLRTIGNMISIVIPTLQREAAELRSAVSEFAGQLPELEQDAELLESAVHAGLQRCMRQPHQQELFAA
jgi:Tfp pilus assembly protein PilO